MKPVLRLDLCDIGHGFEKDRHFILRMLRTRFDVRLTDHPDVLLYGNSGTHHRLHTGRRVFYTDEAVRPDFGVCDYGITSFPAEHDRMYRLPCYVRATDPATLVRVPGDAEGVPAQKTEFCAFAVNYGHRKTQNRIDFFHRLSRYKKVNSCGKVCNNIGGPIVPGRKSKMEFIRRHKFVICFENASHPGYVTEKIADAMEARCIPIYWGSADVARDFNPKSFINVSDFPSIDHAIAHIVRVDNDPSLYRAILEEPCFHGNTPNRHFDPAPLCDFFERILADPASPRGRRGARAFFRNWNRWIVTKRDRV